MRDGIVEKKRRMNFAPGPALLPESVLRQAQEALWDCGLGVGILEVSHRSAYFENLLDEVEERLSRLLEIPKGYDVVFLQGGATLQFGLLPFIFAQKNRLIDCIHTGAWTRNAMRDASIYARIHYAYDGQLHDFQHIPEDTELQYSEAADYVYYCSNNSFEGTEWNTVPQTKAPLFCDMTSNIMTKPIAVDRHALIFASAQKNLGIAGCCLLIAKRSYIEALASEHPKVPAMFDYLRLIEHRSMLNTPPIFAIFMLREMLRWIDAEGGLIEMDRRAQEKSQILRDSIDACGAFYRHFGDRHSRSRITVSFKSPSAELDQRFIEEAELEGFWGLKGHKETGGIRASLFNAISLESVLYLSEFIKEFYRRYS